MRRNPTLKAGTNGKPDDAVSRMISLAEIEPSPNNARKHFNKNKLAELAESIRQRGLLQAILVREIESPEAGKVKYQIIAGERRFRAANLAGLKVIPASVRSMDEDETLSAMLIENLQREDIHPLDEADGFLRLKETQKMKVSDIAQRVAKDKRYVARRLALTNLIEDARDDFRKEYITLAHALEICRLAPEIQIEALAACYEKRTVLDSKKNTYNYVPDKTQPARHVRHLQEWITQNIYLDLKRAAFKLDDARLREDGLTCLDCPQRSGHDKTLFADIKSGDTCLNPLCFQAKLQTFVQIRKSELEEKNGEPVIYISAYYGSGAEAKSLIGRDQYQLIEKNADRCEYAESAIVADGTEIGQVRCICRDRNCKDHLGRVRDSFAYANNGNSRTATPNNRNQRKQELFDIKVDELVRKRVMKEAIKTWAWPLERTHLNEAVKEFFRRIPAEHQRIICEVFGWGEDETKKLRFDEAAALRKLAALNDGELAQFLMLCSFAHFGANQYKNNRVDQKLVVQLSKDRGINHALIDAEVRAELSPKKYRPAHEAYLEVVRSGRSSKKPAVYEKERSAPSLTVDDKSKKKAVSKARPEAQTD
jgi:ParB/RepB/Spo0J family partition protein